MAAECPICVGKMDNTDQRFAPCTCGYRMCAFCYEKITQNENPSCPACRKPYDLSSVAIPVMAAHPPSPSNHHQSHKNKSKAKQKRSSNNSGGGGGGGHSNNNSNSSSSSSSNSSSNSTSGDSGDLHHSLLSYDELSSIRVRQRNLVYVVGLPLSLCDEQVLKSKAWFGQFGKMKKVHCNKKTSHASRNGSCAAYVTYYKEGDAKRAIETMNGRYLDDVRMLKATTGSTKYCSYFLSGSSCSNPNKCLFLHDWANREDVVTKGELNDFGHPTGYAAQSGPHGDHRHHGHHHHHHHDGGGGGNDAHFADGCEPEEQRRTANRTVFLSVGNKKPAASKISKFDYTKIVKQSIAKELGNQHHGQQQAQHSSPSAAMANKENVGQKPLSRAMPKMESAAAVNASSPRSVDRAFPPLTAKNNKMQQFSATPSPMMAANDAAAAKHNETMNALKTRTKPPMALRTKPGADAAVTAKAEKPQKGAMDRGSSFSEKLSAAKPSANAPHAAPPKISLDDAAATAGHSKKSVFFEDLVDVVSGDTVRHRVESKKAAKLQNGRATAKGTKKRTKGRRKGADAAQTPPPQRASHGQTAKVLLEELSAAAERLRAAEQERDGRESADCSEFDGEWKMSDLLRDGMWTADELLMDQYHYYYFVQSEQVIFEQFHHFNAQQKVQKSVKSKA